MSADAGARVEGLEAERLGGRRLDHLPDIDAHGFADLLELVDQRDVHAAVDIFEQLGHLRGRWARRWEPSCGRRCRRAPMPPQVARASTPPITLGISRRGVIMLPGSSRFRRERDHHAIELVGPGLAKRPIAQNLRSALPPPCRLMVSTMSLFGRSGVGSALQHHELSWRADAARSPRWWRRHSSCRECGLRSAA